LGSLFILILWRAGQFVGALFTIVLLCDIFPPRADVLTKAVCVVTAALLSITFHWCAYGYADEKGITFRRYFRQHFVPWDQVREAHWGGWDFARLVIVTAHPMEGSRRIDFYSDRVGMWRAFRRQRTPEAVCWVLHRVKASK